MQLHGVVDVLIPRGGAGLIRHCVETSKVPVIETGTGNCHVYVHESADLAMARAIVVNAKCRRYGVCNAAETLLVDEAARRGRSCPRRWPSCRARRDAARRRARGRRCARRGGIARRCRDRGSDWETEYLAPELAVKCVEASTRPSPT